MSDSKITSTDVMKIVDTVLGSMEDLIDSMNMTFRQQVRSKVYAQLHEMELRDAVENLQAEVLSLQDANRTLKRENDNLQEAFRHVEFP